MTNYKLYQHKKTKEVAKIARLKCDLTGEISYHIVTSGKVILIDNLFDKNSKKFELPDDPNLPHYVGSVVNINDYEPVTVQ